MCLFRCFWIGTWIRVLPNMKCADKQVTPLFGYIIILVITFMHGIYNCVPEANHDPRVYSVLALLYLQFVLHVTLLRQRNWVIIIILLLR